MPGLVEICPGRSSLPVDEEVAVRQAEAIGDIDYVYFRRFSDGRSSQVAAYVIDNGDDRFTKLELADIHKRVWLNGSAPLLYVGWQTQVDVLSCARGPDFWHNDNYRYCPAQENPEGTPARGKITDGLAAGTLVGRTIEFVRTELPNWRDTVNRPPEESEERLNAQLCKHLQVRARHSLNMVFFHHEEKQTGRSRIDLSAAPTEDAFVGTTFHTIYDPFLVLEGKRLPPPKNSSGREREYVTGGDGKSGGIQRFKLGLHGAKHDIAVMIGYVQAGTPAEWNERVNGWIRELEGTLQSDGTKWSSIDRLSCFVENKGKRIANSVSKHLRTGEVFSPNILIHHLWAQM